MIASKIKELRNEKKLTQRDLSKILNVSQQTIASWEVGRAEPNSEMINKLANYFSVSTDYLLGRESISNTRRNKNDARQLILRADTTGLTDDQIKELEKDMEDFFEYRMNKIMKEKE